jgi:hypothetical protein
MADTVKKVTVNVPSQILERARTITGRGVTETIVQGLIELDRQQKRSALRLLRGRVRFDLNLAETRR